MARQLTQETYNKYNNELKKLVKELEELYIIQADAKEQTDLRENSEYEGARDEIAGNNARQVEIRDILKDAEIVLPDTSTRISVGSKIGVTLVDNNTKEPIQEEMILIYDMSGTPVIDKVLPVTGPLGQAIYNGTDGFYTINTRDTYTFKIRKIIGE